MNNLIDKLKAEQVREKIYSGKQYNEGYFDGLTKAVGIAQSHDHWISVEDELPPIAKGETTSEDVLITGISSNFRAKGEELTSIAWVDKKGSWHFIMEDKGNTFSEVIAWMPMPRREPKATK